MPSCPIAPAAHPERNHARKAPRTEGIIQKFIIQQNIEHYRRLLTTEANPARRQMILKLLAEEEYIFGSLNEPSEPKKPGET